MADKQHNTLTGSDLHEPKGVATANADEVYVADGAASGTWKKPEEAVFPMSDPPWDGIYLPPRAFWLPATGNPAEDTDGSLLFDAASTETIYSVHNIPRGFQSTTNLNFGVYWSKSTSASGDVAWELSYKLTAASSVMSGSWTSLGVVTTPITTDSDTTDQIQVTDCGFIDLATFEHTDLLMIKLDRVGGDSGDTYGADANFYGLDLTFVRDRIGDEDEWPT